MLLLQKSSSLGLGAYSGSNESMFGAKGPANFLVKLTFVLGIVFVVNTIFLGYTYNTQREESIVDKVDTTNLVPTVPTTNQTTAPTPPTVPTTK